MINIPKNRGKLMDYDGTRVFPGGYTPTPWSTATVYVNRNLSERANSQATLLIACMPMGYITGLLGLACSLCFLTAAVVIWTCVASRSSQSMGDFLAQPSAAPIPFQLLQSCAQTRVVCQTGAPPPSLPRLLRPSQKKGRRAGGRAGRREDRLAASARSR